MPGSASPAPLLDGGGQLTGLVPPAGARRVRPRLMVTPLSFGTDSRSRLISSPNSHGSAYPTVSAMLIVEAPASMVFSITSQR